MLSAKVSPSTAAFLNTARPGRALPDFSEIITREIEGLRLLPNSIVLPSVTDGRLTPSESHASTTASRSNERLGGTMALMVTQRCNLRCTYCYAGGGEYGQPGVMDEATAMRAVDWFLEHCGPDNAWISFFGGEPFLNYPLIRSVTDYARKKCRGRAKPVRFSITTNGTLLDLEKIAFLEANDFYTIVSIDGPKETFDRLRRTTDGSSAYDKATAWLSELLAARTDKVKARATLTVESDPQAVQEEFERLGFTQYHAVRAARSRFSLPASPVEDAAESEFYERLLDLSHRKVRSWLEALRQRDVHLLRALQASLDFTLPMQGDFVGRGVAHIPKRRFHCGVGNTFKAVSINGDIYPCHRFVGESGFKMGSIFNGSHCLTDFSAAPIDAAMECRQCWARHLCGGGCLHEHLGDTGDIRKPSPRSCQHAKARAQLRIVLWSSMTREDQCWLVEQGLASNEHCLLDFG